ncbi:hypothetical protein BT69DRAFT_1315034 [Atractiella rhizophila]|nr:hypothetical protein BT69DRAFT_1315034 [Atractiella rhizophila]
MPQDLFTLTADPTPLPPNHPFHFSRSLPTDGKKKVLKSHLALLNYSSEPAVSSRARKATTSLTSDSQGKKRGISRNEKLRLERSVSSSFARKRRANGAGIESAMAETTEEERNRVLGDVKGKTAEENIWADGGDEGKQTTSSSFVAPRTRAANYDAVLVNNVASLLLWQLLPHDPTRWKGAAIGKIEPPPKVQLPPSALKSEKMKMPHPGSSYNPSLTSHQSLLSVNHESAIVEEEKESAARAVKDQMEAGREDRKRKRIEGVEDEVGSGEEASGGEAEGDADWKKGPRRKKKKLSSLKKEARKEEEKRLEEKKRLKAQRRQIDELAVPESIEEKAIVPYEPQPSKPLPVEEVEVDLTFQLTDSLAPSLRQLEPEGSLIRDFDQRTKKMTGLGGLKKGGIKGGQGRGGKDAQKHWKNKEKIVEKPGWRFWQG